MATNIHLDQVHYFSEICFEEVMVFASSKILSQTGDLGKTIINFVSSIGFDFCKKWLKVNGL